LLGALATPLWESFEKPVLTFARDAALNLSTLGMQSLVDGIYYDVGRGQYERGAERLVVVVTALYILLILFTMPRLIRRIINSSNVGIPRIPDRREVNLLMSIVFVFCSTVVMFDNVTTIYKIEASVNLERYQSIVAPYIDENQRLVFKSRIAQIRTRVEFVTIIQDMKSIIQKNNLYDPAISIF